MASLAMPCDSRRIRDYRPGAALLIGLQAPATSATNQHSAPCRRRAFFPDAHIVRFPPANPAAEYRSRSAQSKSAFDIGQCVRIWRKTGALCRSGIVGANRTTSPRLFALLVSRHKHVSLSQFEIRADLLPNKKIKSVRIGLAPSECRNSLEE